MAVGAGLRQAWGPGERGGRGRYRLRSWGRGRGRHAGQMKTTHDVHDGVGVGRGATGHGGRERVARSPLAGRWSCTRTDRTQITPEAEERRVAR